MNAEADALRAALSVLYREAVSGEWHSKEDCQIEGRASTCALCEALRKAAPLLVAPPPVHSTPAEYFPMLTPYARRMVAAIEARKRDEREGKK